MREFCEKDSNCFLLYFRNCWVGPTERRYPVTHREDKKMWNCHINLVRCVLDSVDILGGIGCAAALVWTAAVTGIHTKKTAMSFVSYWKWRWSFFHQEFLFSNKEQCFWSALDTFHFSPVFADYLSEVCERNISIPAVADPYKNEAKILP